jgi:dinuclear metal center YbgI/SA1388 family protein
MLIQDIIQVIENFAPRSLQESYDNAGLIVGDPKAAVSKVLLCLDTTEAVLEEAKQKGCNLIIAHHPIVFKGIKQLNGKNYVERVIIEAIKNDVAIFVAHTNLDHVRQGVSAQMAAQLGLINTQVLSPKEGILHKLVTYVPHAHVQRVQEALYTAGAGNVGKYSNCSFTAPGKGYFKGSDDSNPFIGTPGVTQEVEEQRLELVFPNYLQGAVLAALKQAHPYEEVAFDVLELKQAWNEVGAGLVGELPEAMEEMAFLTWVKSQFKTGCVRYTALRGKPIKRVAVCGGSGSFLLSKALRSGADAYITADFKYHEFFDAENQLVIVDVGHFESEQFVVDLFYHILTENFRNFAPLKSTINTNPVNYL